MTFDISKFHSIFEAASDETSTASNNTEIDIDMQKPLPAEHNDETGANLDNTLGDADLLSLFDDICPISGDVFAAMKNAAKDPKNLKITMVKSGDGDESKLFVEATEFANYVEASGLTIGEAAEEIIDTYKEDIPEMDNAEVHVVFPSDSLNKNILGSEEYGVDTKNTWPMQLIRGCRRYGLKVNVADDESKNLLSESSSKELLDKTKDKVKDIWQKEKDYVEKVGSKVAEKISDKQDELARKAAPTLQKVKNSAVSKINDYKEKHPDSKLFKESSDEEPLDEAVKNKEDEDKELAKARSDKKLLTSEANAASERAFPAFKEKFEKKLSGKTDNYSKNRLQEFESFCKKNKSAPKVKGFDFESTDYAMIFFGGYYPSDDWILFYQDEVAKEMNKSEELKKAGYRFGTEDYPGIFCYC